MCSRTGGIASFAILYVNIKPIAVVHCRRHRQTSRMCTVRAGCFRLRHRSPIRIITINWNTAIHRLCFLYHRFAVKLLDISGIYRRTAKRNRKIRAVEKAARNRHLNCIRSGVVAMRLICHYRGRPRYIAIPTVFYGWLNVRSILICRHGNTAVLTFCAVRIGEFKSVSGKIIVPLCARISRKTEIYSIAIRGIGNFPWIYIRSIRGARCHILPVR